MTLSSTSKSASEETVEEAAPEKAIPPHLRKEEMGFLVLNREIGIIFHDVLEKAFHKAEEAANLAIKDIEKGQDEVLKKAKKYDNISDSDIYDRLGLRIAKLCEENKKLKNENEVLKETKEYLLKRQDQYIDQIKKNDEAISVGKKILMIADSSKNVKFRNFLLTNTDGMNRGMYVNWGLTLGHSIYSFFTKELNNLK